MLNILKKMKSCVKGITIRGFSSFELISCILLPAFIGAFLYQSVCNTNLETAISNLKAKVKSVQLINTETTKAHIASLTDKITILKAKLDTREADIQHVASYITDNYKTICSDVANQIANKTVTLGDKHGVPTEIIVAVMEQESHFNFMAVGSVGERGLLQVRYNIHGKKLGIASKYDLHNISTGIEAGVRVLREYLEVAEFDIDRALYKYNGGSNTYVNEVKRRIATYSTHVSLRRILEKEKTNKI